MPASKKTSPIYLVPLALIVTLSLVPLAPSWAQTGADQVGSAATETDTASDVASPPRQGAECNCGRCRHSSAEGAQGKERSKGAGCQEGGGKSDGIEHKGRGRAEMQNAHFLVTNHDRLERKVKDIPNGVQTLTTTDDPELLEPLREHVREMSAMLEGGGHLRKWDPLFAEIFENGESIRIDIEEIENGVLVTEVSDDEEVVKLIRAHARKVDQFVTQGHEACRKETPLPDDYAGR